MSSPDNEFLAEFVDSLPLAESVRVWLSTTACTREALVDTLISVAGVTRSSAILLVDIAVDAYLTESDTTSGAASAIAS